MENWKKVGKRVASYFVVISGLIMIVLILFSILAWVDFRSETEGTTVAIGIAVLTYALSVIVLKIFTKEEIFMIPYGQKIYKFLQKFGIYREQQIQ